MKIKTDDKLITDEEWATLVAADYEAHGAPVDEIAKARVWERIKTRVKPRKPLRHLPWQALAAVVIAAVGLTEWLAQRDTWREKGGAAVISAVITPYILAEDGTTIPAEVRVRAATTIVFRVHAAQIGFYALVVSDSSGPARLAVDQGKMIGADDQLVTKNGAIFGIKIGPGLTRVCVLAASGRNELSERLKDLSAVLAKLPNESCTVLEAGPP